MKNIVGCLLILPIVTISQYVKSQNQLSSAYFDSLLYIFQTSKDDSVKGLFALNITQVKMENAQNSGNWDDAIEWAKKGLHHSIKSNFRFGIRRCNWQLGRNWMLKGDYPKAVLYFTGMLNAAIQEDIPKPIETAYYWIGNCYMLLGNYNEALKNLQAGLNICIKRSAEIFDFESDRTRLILKIGDSHLKSKDYSKALECYKKLLDERQADNTGEMYAKLALAQIGMKNYDDAKKSLQTAIKRLPNLLDRKVEVELKGILGSFLLQIGEAYCKLGQIQEHSERKNTYNEAINYLSKSLDLLKDGTAGQEALIDAYALLKEACEDINDYQKALYYSNLYNHLKDSIYNKTTYLKLADQQIKFETEKAAAILKSEQEKERIEQDALRDKMLADQKLVDQKIIDEEKLNKEKSIAEEKLRSANLIASEKAKQEKLRAQKQQTNNLLLMGLILVVVTSVFLMLYLRQRHQKKRAVEKAESIHKMAELELQSLRAQLNPHFMFNSLNSLQRLILMEESDKSQSYLSRFSKMLRMLLENADKPFIPLQREIDFLQLYLGLEKLRVPDLQYSISTDPSLNTEQTLIPNMILQPYVENAIWHGLSHKENDKQVQVRIYREIGSLNCEVEDNGVGRKKAEELKSLFRKQHQSKGMELLTKRFKLLNEEFGSSIQATVTDKKKDEEDSGTLVTIKIPVMQTD